MNKLKLFAVLLGLSFIPKMNAQVGIGIEIGPEPNCPYGYYDTAPYACAPYGYYGPEWFAGGVFIGVGRWFHGPRNFHGHINGNLHPEHGYKGSFPERGEKPVAHSEKFKGNERISGVKGHAAAHGGAHKK